MKVKYIFSYISRIVLTWACLIAATGIDAAGGLGGGGWAAGGGTAAGVRDGGGVDGGGGGGGGGGAAAVEAGIGLGAFSAGFDAAAPPDAPMSIVHIFCPGFTVSPSFAKISFITPAPGDGTGTDV